MAAEHTFRVQEDCSFHPLPAITLNAEQINELGWRPYLFVQVTLEQGALSVTCLLLTDPKKPVDREELRLSKRARLALGSLSPSRLTVTPPGFGLITAKMPRVEEISGSQVRACPALIAEFSENVEVINPVNGHRLNLTLQADRNAAPDALYLNRYAKLLLGTKGAEDKLVITMGRHIPKPRSWLRRGLERAFIRPVFKQFFPWLAQLFIGKRELELRTGYTFPFDEHLNLCRVHPNVRKLLGLEETDQLIITYGGHSIKLPVLDIDPENIDQLVKVDNTDSQRKFIDSHLFIGITALARKKLDIPNMGTAVIVKRSMYSLLLKHLNKLILPVIALLFTVMQLYKDLNWSISFTVLVSLVLLPVIIYTSLSEERAKIK